MNFRNKKLLRLLPALALAFVLCVGSMSAVFAADPIGKIENQPVDATFTKILELPEGTTVPDVEFKFTFTKKSLNGIETEIAKGKMPGIAEKTIAFEDGDETESTNGLVSIPKEPETNIFYGVNFLQAGIYVYSVKETQENGPYDFDNDSGTEETMTYSQAEYEIIAYVKEKTTDKSLYIYAIATKEVKKDDGTAGSGDKIDPTPGGGANYDYSQMIFTNTYTKTIEGEDPTDPDDSTLEVSKVVAGDFASKTTYFPFELTVTAPATVVSDPLPVYKGYVVEKVGNVETVVTSFDNSSAVHTPQGGDPYIEFISGAGTTVNLKHGQRVVFIDTPVGTKYVAVETGTLGYVPSVEIVYDGGQPVAGATVASGADLSTGNRLVGEKANSAAFTNTYDTSSPTGLDWDDMPYYLLMLLIIAAGVIYLAVRSRRKTEPEA